MLKKYRRFLLFRKGLFWGVIVGVTTITSGIVGASLTFIQPINQALTLLINRIEPYDLAPTKLSLNSKKLPPISEPINILLIEIKPLKNNSNLFAGSYEKILLLQFEPRKPLLKVVNIPQNSRVVIPSLGMTQISKVNRYGGAKLLTKVVSQNSINLGISSQKNLNIHGYLNISNLAVEQLSDRFTIQDFNQKIFPQSGKLKTLSNWQQQKVILKQIHQDWRSPEFADRIPQLLSELEQYIDTNLTTTQILVLANFIHQLKPEQISLTMLPRSVKDESKIFDATRKTRKKRNLNKIYLPEANELFKHTPIAVQNTTDNPELVINLLHSLKKQNFQNVHLIEHLPVNLNQTEIIVEQGNIILADYLKKSLGLGRLELSPNNGSNFELTIRIGEDAQYLNLEDGFIRN